MSTQFLLQKHQQFCNGYYRGLEFVLAQRQPSALPGPWLLPGIDNSGVENSLIDESTRLHLHLRQEEIFPKPHSSH
jgi:hypothetical protein